MFPNREISPDVDGPVVTTNYLPMYLMKGVIIIDRTVQKLNFAIRYVFSTGASNKESF